MVGMIGVELRGKQGGAGGCGGCMARTLHIVVSFGCRYLFVITLDGDDILYCFVCI